MNAVSWINAASFFPLEQSYTPTRSTEGNTTPSKPIDAADFARFCGKDLATLLGQGPIKKIPKMNEERLKKQKEKNNEPLSEEMKAQMIELFWEDHDKFIW